MARSTGALACSLLFAGIAFAQTIPMPEHWANGNGKEGASALFGGKVWVEGSEAAFQRTRQVNDGYFGGLASYHGKNEMSKDLVMTVDARVAWGRGDHEFIARLDHADTGLFLEAGWRQSRVFYDGGGGWAPLTDRTVMLYDERMHIDRVAFWVEGGIEKEVWSGRIRYEHQSREGMKDSTSWGDTTAGNITPAFYGIDESRDIFLVDLDYDLKTVEMGAGMRWENIEFDNTRNIRRNPGQATSDRYVTQHDVNDSDLFAVHGFVTSKIGDSVMLSGAASRTTIDTNLEGNSRIIGSRYDAEFSETYPTRQNRDHGFIDFEGGAEWNQTLLSANAAYLPDNGLRIVGGLRFENQKQETVADFIDTEYLTSPAPARWYFPEIEAGTERDFDETLGSLEASYGGVANWVFSGSLELSSGDGNLMEERLDIEEPALDITRDTGFDRSCAKYGLAARWYPTQDIHLGFGFESKTQENDYDTVQDSTPPTGGDRFPAFITRQKFTTDVLYGRVTWRPASAVSVTGRYDYKETAIKTSEMGIADVPQTDIEAHVISGIVTWAPMASLFLQGSINQTYDQIVTGAAKTIYPSGHANGRFDNNCQTIALMALCAIDDSTDIQVDYARYHANNWRNIAAITLPLGMEATDNNYGITLNRTVSEDMVWSLRYAHVSYDEPSSGGAKDFNADIVYGRVQLRF
jgi:hypothetical protein